MKIAQRLYSYELILFADAQLNLSIIMPCSPLGDSSILANIPVPLWDASILPLKNGVSNKIAVKICVFLTYGLAFTLVFGGQTLLDR